MLFFLLILKKFSEKVDFVDSGVWTAAPLLGAGLRHNQCD